MSIYQDDPEVIIRNDKFQVVDSFCYLGDFISQPGSCSEAKTDRVRAAWKNFHSLLPVLTNSGISLKVRGHACNAFICNVLLYASESYSRRHSPTCQKQQHNGKMDLFSQIK